MDVLPVGANRFASTGGGGSTYTAGQAAAQINDAKDLRVIVREGDTGPTYTPTATDFPEAKTADNDTLLVVDGGGTRRWMRTPDDGASWTTFYSETIGTATTQDDLFGYITGRTNANVSDLPSSGELTAAGVDDKEGANVIAFAPDGTEVHFERGATVWAVTHTSSGGPTADGFDVVADLATRPPVGSKADGFRVEVETNNLTYVVKDGAYAVEDFRIDVATSADFAGITEQETRQKVYDEESDDLFIWTGTAWAEISGGELNTGGGSHPDLAAHDALGLATQAELDAVAAIATTANNHATNDEVSSLSTAHNWTAVQTSEPAAATWDNGTGTLTFSPNSPPPQPVTIDANVTTVTTAAGLKIGQLIQPQIEDAGTQRTIAWPAAYGDAAAFGYDLTTGVASQPLLVSLRWDGTNWRFR